VDFVEISNFCARKEIIEAAKRIINSDKVCRGYSDLNFGVTFLEHSVDPFSSFSVKLVTDRQTTNDKQNLTLLAEVIKDGGKI